MGVFLDTINSIRAVFTEDLAASDGGVAPLGHGEVTGISLLKQQALDMATATASTRGEQPTLRDYMNAAQQLGGMSMAAYADLSGQEIHGFLIRSEDMRAIETEQAQQQPPVNVNWSFDDTKFYNVTFRPATSYDPERSAGAVFNNVTFDGMDDNQQVTLANASYQGEVKFTNIRGGTINVGDRVRVEGGLNIRGVHAALHIGAGAVINGLDANGANLIEMTAGRGATINNPLFDHATISMASQLQGSIWRGAEDVNSYAFVNSNLTNVDFTGATLVNIRVKDSDLRGMNLSGARVTNLIIDGKLIRNADQLRQLGISADGATTITVTPEAERDFALSRALGAGRALNQSIQAIGAPLAMPALPSADIQQAAPAAAPATTLDLAFSALTHAAGATLNAAINSASSKPVTAPDNALGLTNASPLVARIAEPTIESANPGHRLFDSLNHGDLINSPPPPEARTVAPKTPDDKPITFAQISGGESLTHADGITRTAALPQTEQARSAIDARNSAFAQSQQALTTRNGQ